MNSSASHRLAATSGPPAPQIRDPILRLGGSPPHSQPCYSLIDPRLESYVLCGHSRCWLRRPFQFVQVSASKTMYSPLPEEDSLHDTNDQKAKPAFGAVVVKYHIAAEEVATSSL